MVTKITSGRILKSYNRCKNVMYQSKKTRRVAEFLLMRIFCNCFLGSNIKISDIRAESVGCLADIQFLAAYPPPQHQIYLDTCLFYTRQFTKYTKVFAEEKAKKSGCRLQQRQENFSSPNTGLKIKRARVCRIIFKCFF